MAAAERLYGCSVTLPALATEDARVYRCVRSGQRFILKALPTRQRPSARVLGVFDFVATSHVESQSAHGEFPWRTFEQHTAELKDRSWIDALFAPVLQALGSSG